MSKSTALVLNWHLTEACNYRCQYCYAKWSEHICQQELISKPLQTTTLLRKLYGFFRPDNRSHPLAQKYSWTSVRLNLAGGEPLLHKNRFLSIVEQAHDIGFDVSVISNGSYFNTEILSNIAPKLTWLGISLDSLNPTTNIAIGRVDYYGNLIKLDTFASDLIKAQELNPNLKIKLNTVVNKLNHDENLSSLIHKISPKKWKILRMLPVINNDLNVTDKQFTDFVTRHQSFSDIFCVEDNDDMRESYIMIDPYGHFYQNNSKNMEQGYTYSRPILEVGIEAAFAEIPFSYESFSTRYIPEITRLDV